MLPLLPGHYEDDNMCVILRPKELKKYNLLLAMFRSKPKNCLPKLLPLTNINPNLETCNCLYRKLVLEI
jgi:hypothetical protein